MAAGGADDCLHGANDDVWLSVEALDEVVAAQGNDVQMPRAGWRSRRREMNSCRVGSSARSYAVGSR